MSSCCPGWWVPAESLFHHLVAADTGIAHPAEGHRGSPCITGVGGHLGFFAGGVGPEIGVDGFSQCSHGLIDLRCGGIVIVHDGGGLIDGLFQGFSPVAAAVAVELQGFVDGVLQLLLVDVHVNLPNRGVAEEVHEVQTGFGEVGGTLVGVGEEPDLDESRCGLCQFKPYRVGDPYPGRERGHRGVRPGLS